MLEGAPSSRASPNQEGRFYGKIPSLKPKACRCPVAGKSEEQKYPSCQMQKNGACARPTSGYYVYYVSRSERLQSTTPTASTTSTSSTTTSGTTSGSGSIVDCTITAGSITCSSCPEGMAGDGSVSGGCYTLCGDGICEAFESCLNCKDCPSPCGLCGDHQCNATVGETCSSCPQDCGYCVVKTCQGDPPCSGHGSCSNGVCVCSGLFTGPTCATQNEPVRTNLTDSNPGVSLTPNTTSAQQQTTFTIVFSELREVDGTGTVVYSIDMTGSNFTLESDSTNSTLNKQWVYNTTLENLAGLSVTIYEFQDDVTNITFAGTTTSYAKNSLKLSVEIGAWPFRGYQNSLILIFTTGAQTTGAGCQQVNSFSGEGSLQWFSINIEGTTMYGQFEQNAIVDGIIRPISFSLGSNDTTVAAKISHFWNYAVIDPSFSVLLEDPPDCSSHATSHTLVVAVSVVVPLVVFVIVLGAMTWRFVIPRVRLTLQTRRLRGEGVGLDHIDSKSELNIERVYSREITTHAGKFVVQL